MLWTDLAVERMAYAVRMVRPDAQRRHEERWSDFEYAMFSARDLRDIVQIEPFLPSDPESDFVWIRSPNRNFSTVEAIFQKLIALLACADIPRPSLDDVLSDDTDLINSAVGRTLVPTLGFVCLLKVRGDLITWLDHLNYAHVVGSLRIAERAWKTAQHRHYKQKLILAARAAHRPL